MVISKFWRCNNRTCCLLWVSVIFLAISLVTRVGLTWYEGDATNYHPATLARIFAVGLVYDLAALVWFIIPFVLIMLVTPTGRIGRRVHAVLSTTWLALCVGGLVFQAVAEFVFWNEFSSRFNFIAVDYLVFTREVIGNVQQSYPTGLIFTGIGIVSVLILALVVVPYVRAAAAAAPPLRTRLALFVGLSLLLPAVVFFGLGEGLHRPMAPSARELGSNGLYSLFRAYRNNELSYEKYYRLLPEKIINEVLAGELVESHALAEPLEPAGRDPLHRHILAQGTPIKKNVILVSIESLGSDYVDAFDGIKGLTPNLDAIAAQGLIFTNLYATGLRTVRGLEAITLSLPPTPGRAVPMREHNKGLPTLGGIFEQLGYEALYLYGGYSLFDNMNDFFGGNGYRVVDRTSIPDSEITHETIWGVADEDLYRMSLREIDALHAAGTPFFAHIMTTSNHRPYTYPDGRVPIPSHTGRDGAVQYTDWAIGEFMRECEQRPWFGDTVFVFVADHTSHGRGRIDLPPENYRIPLIFYAPGFIAPGRVDAVASQIDIGPTLLALLNVDYESHFFGQDVLHEATHHPRAFMANYLTVGYMERGLIIMLGPRQYVRVVDAESGAEIDQDNPLAAELISEAISYYQAASEYIADKTGLAESSSGPPP